MPSIEQKKKQNHLLWQQVRKEKDTVNAIQLAADIGEEAVNAGIDERESIMVEIHKINVKLSGNGDPSHSIIARLEDIEAIMKTTKAMLYSVLLLVVGEMLLRLIGLF